MVVVPSHALLSTHLGVWWDPTLSSPKEPRRMGGKGDLLLVFYSASPLSLYVSTRRYDKPRRKRRKREGDNEGRREIIIIITHFIYNSQYIDHPTLILSRYYPSLTLIIYNYTDRDHVFTRNILIMNSGKRHFSKIYVLFKRNLPWIYYSW